MTQPAMGTFTTEAGVFTVAPFQDENRPFHIKMLGIEPGGFSTACYEGFLPSYAMWKSRLYLDRLWLLGRRCDLPDVCGIAPECPDKPEEYGTCNYFNLRLPLGFNGDLEVTTDTDFTAWRGHRDGMKIRFTLTFHGGLLRAADNTSYNIDTAMNHVYCPPNDRPIDNLPLPSRSTPFDDWVIPLTEHEKKRIADEAKWEAEQAEREAKRRARTEESE
jgi:hypothetical protein